MQSAHPTVLILDDDAYHLEVYGELASRAGFEAVPVLVRFAGPHFPAKVNVTAIVLDYRLNCFRPTADLAREIRELYPGRPIVLLSDLWSVPPEMKPYTDHFVRKGDGEQLVEVLRQLGSRRSG